MSVHKCDILAARFRFLYLCYIAHTFFISSNFVMTLIANIRASFKDCRTALVISTFAKGSLNVFKSVVASADWFSSRTKVSDLPTLLTQIAGLDREINCE